jgi:aspartyl/glutamyl-tRNA(Asn/Gln) amidotransferase C subunit
MVATLPGPANIVGKSLGSSPPSSSIVSGMPNPPPVDRTLLLHLADLARLHLSPERLPILRERLERIIAAFSGLDDVVPDAATPHAAAACRLRADRIEPPLPTATVLANSPATAGSSFLVPRVIDA